MSRRLDYDYVYNYFKSNGCELLEDEYINNITKMKFICSCGDVGEKHWAGYRLHPTCPKCSRKNSDKGRGSFSYEYVSEFVEENSDCVLLSKEYFRNSDNLKFICGCGQEFQTTFAKFKDRNKRQCNDCSYRSSSEKNSHTYEYVKHFIEVESGSGCTLVSEEYTNNSKPLDLICVCGKEFVVTFQKFSSETRKTRHCESCSTLIRRAIFATPYEEVKRIVESKGCKLRSEEYVNARERIDVTCSCGNDYSLSFDAFQSGQDRCAECSGRVSRYELETEEYLLQHGVSYEKEFRILDCKNDYPLPFDFAIMDKNDNVNFLIEVDGQQHFYPIEVFGGEEVFAEQKKRDAIKDEFCEKNDILLVRIPYYDIEDIDSYLKHLI